MRLLLRLCATAMLVLALLVPFRVRADDSSNKAREYFQQGTAAFNLGRFADAVKAWEEGYKLRPDPIFLYNIAQAHRLADNHEQAVFFYKSYLRNSPNAKNREEVQMRLDQLAKLIEEKKKARDAQPDTTLGPTGNKPQTPDTTTPPPTTTTTTPPPTSQPTTATPPTTNEPDTTVVKTATPERPRKVDLGVAAGVNIWALGIPSGVEPSAAISIGGGYTVLKRGRIEFRVGAKLGYSYVQDLAFPANTAFVSFLSVLAEPEVRVGLWKEKLYFFGGVGLGAQMIVGLKHGSGLLQNNAKPSGVFAHFEARPMIGIEYRVIPALALFLAPQIIISPAPNKYFNESLLMRVDISLGASVRL